VVEKTEVNSRGGVVGGKVLTRLECLLAYHARYSFFKTQFLRLAEKG